MTACSNDATSPAPPSGPPEKVLAPPGAATSELHEVLRGYVDIAQRLQRTDEALRCEVVRLRRELASKDRELERRRRLAALGELAAGVAHEVRNPLGALQLYSGLLRNECHRIEPALRLIEKMEAGIRVIEGVVQDTLALAPRSCNLTRRRLRTIVERAQDVCLGKLRSGQVTLRTHYDDPEVQVLVDEDGLQRALVNLIVNAAEASPAHGVVTVQVGREQNRQVEVRIADDGPGLPGDVLDRIFDPFFTTKPNGTGLGLTIAHRLIEAQGGRLTARNRPESGAEFVLELLTVSPAESARPSGNNAQQPSAA